MLIQHKLSGNKGIFFIPDEEEGILAEIVYSLQTPNMIVEHTEVDEELRGQNIGYQMVHTLVEHARSHNLKIVPLCPFVKSVMDKKPEYKDVLAA